MVRIPVCCSLPFLLPVLPSPSEKCWLLAATGWALVLSVHHNLVLILQWMNGKKACKGPQKLPGPYPCLMAGSALPKSFLINVSLVSLEWLHTLYTTYRTTYACTSLHFMFFQGLTETSPLQFDTVAYRLACCESEAINCCLLYFVGILSMISSLLLCPTSVLFKLWGCHCFFSFFVAHVS